MSPPAQPTSPGALNRIWRVAVPHPPVSSSDALLFNPSSRRVAVGCLNAETVNHSINSVGSLTLLDASTGDVLGGFSGDCQVYALACSPDGRSLASLEYRFGDEPFSFEEHRIRVLDADTLVERCRYQGVLPPRGFMFHPLIFSNDGHWIAATHGSITFAFDATDGTERWHRSFPEVSSQALSPDSRSVALGRPDGITVLETPTGTDHLLIPTPTAVANATYSPDNRQIVAATQDGTLRGFDASTGAPVWSVEVGSFNGPSFAVSDDCLFVAAAGHTDVGNTVGVFNLRDGMPRFSPVQLPIVFNGNPPTVLYSPTLRHIVVNCPPGGPVSSAQPPYVAVLDAATGRQVGALTPAGQGEEFMLAPDGESIVIRSGDSVELYNLGLEVSRCGVDAGITAVEMSPDETPVVAVADSTAAVTVFAASTGTRLARKPIPGTITSMVLADRGQSVAVGGSTGVRLFSIIGDRSWLVDTIGSVNALAAVGSAGDWLATAAGRLVRLLASTDGHDRWSTPHDHPQIVTRLAVSSDGNWIATGCADRTTRVLDVATGTARPCFTGDGKVQAIAFQPGHTLLATGNEDGTVVLVEAATATEFGRITGSFGCTHIAFSPDATLLATACEDDANTVSIYDLTAPGTLQKLREFTHPTPITALVFNPADGTIAVTTEGGTTVTLRDPRSGIEQARIPRPNPVRDIAISADGALIATASDDNIVRVWASGTLMD
ncbi:MAG: repeat protein [Streptosporangiaceae bacterium]|nr:repeat protein [Streptosporangiaceae bacterium]